MTDGSTIGELLRNWRQRRKLSQLDLAIRAGVSSRHVSFVETGRTLPSRPMIAQLADALAVPLRERNHLLVAAGYAPAYRARPLDDPDLAAARSALQQVLDGLEPNPALVLDRGWNLVLANKGARIFFADVAAELLEPPVNMMRLGLHPDGFAPKVQNLPQVRAFLLPRLARQAHQSGDPALTALHAELLSYGGPLEAVDPDPAEILLPIRLRHRGHDLELFTTITSFGAPFDATLEELAIETYFPATRATAEALHQLS